MILVEQFQDLLGPRQNLSGPARISQDLSGFAKISQKPLGTNRAYQELLMSSRIHKNMPGYVTTHQNPE